MLYPIELRAQHRRFGFPPLSPATAGRNLLKPVFLGKTKTAVGRFSNDTGNARPRRRACIVRPPVAGFANGAGRRAGRLYRAVEPVFGQGVFKSDL